MTASPSPTQRLRVAHLNPRAPTPFALEPDEATRRAIAGELDLQGLPRLVFSGQITAEGSEGWALSGRLTAEAVQSCVVTLAPVTSRIDVPVQRHYSPHLPQPEAAEVEMPDETLEPLGAFIDLSAVMIEDLSLALPDYPRAKGADLPPDIAAQPDPGPETRRPFADLERLLRKDG